MKERPWFEGKKSLAYNTEMDKWLAAVDKLSKSIEELKSAKEKFKQKLSKLKAVSKVQPDKKLKQPEKPDILDDKDSDKKNSNKEKQEDKDLVPKEGQKKKTPKKKTLDNQKEAK